jgi:GNAT superfamily N-acetyltransferase
MRFVDMQLARRLELAGHTMAGTEDAGAPAQNGKDRILVGGGIAVFAGINSPATQAEGLGLHGPVSEEEFERLEEFFRSRGSAVFIEVCPMADAWFIEALGKRGYRVVEFSNVLIREIQPGEAYAGAPAGITVRKPKPAEERLFAETMARGFVDYFEPTEEFIASMRSFFSGSAVHPYLVFVEGKAAGGGTLTLRNGVAGLLGSSTLPEFRQQGIQSALIRVRLEDARAAGCNLAMSMTLPASGSQRNLERQGFRVVYTRAKFVREWAADTRA